MLDHSTTVQIPLRAKDGSVRAYALVDAADAVSVSQYRWSFNGRYAMRSVRRHGSGRYSTIYLHREIVGITFWVGLEGDHINRNKLDCRRENIRVVTTAQNQQNVSSVRGSSSQFRGVSWRQEGSCWEACVQTGGHTYYLGRYASEIEAANVAREARSRLLPYATD